ncbi:conserved hypothetical protein [Ricinus communis]|uniref:Uncharacterized protein n=1 Tax=Ricinus communis TaxID=3988 RepID=B9TQ22_RICCO|nr:conserved hypothetical protein [Ricinus communis]
MGTEGAQGVRAAGGESADRVEDGQQAGKLRAGRLHQQQGHPDPAHGKAAALAGAVRHG